MLFAFKQRCLVHFAVDTELVFMTTKLEGKETAFLPFNLGQGHGAGKPVSQKPAKGVATEDVPAKAPRDRSFAEWLPQLPPHLTDLLVSLEDYVGSIGDDVQRKELRLYLAFKRLKNFATVVAQKNRLLLYLHLNPQDVGPLPTIGRDVSQQGHWGTGDLELSLISQADLETAKPLIVRAYQGRSGA